MAHPQSPPSSGSCRLSGTDRLLHVPDISTFNDSTIILDTPVTAQTLPRLEKISETFQRIKWHKLHFRVVPQVSTASSGGYVASFFADPSDQVSPTQFGLSKMTSQQGAKTCKWWETAKLVSPLGKDTLFTSFTPEDPRLGSPGKVVIACDGKASQRGGLTVYVDWDVELTLPSLEGAREDEGSIPSLQCDLWTLAGSQKIYAMTVPGKTDKLDSDARRALPGAEANTTFRLSSPRYFGLNRNNVVSGIVGFARIHIDSRYQMWASTDVSDMEAGISADTNLIASKGENVEFVTADKVFLVGSKYLCHLPQWWRSRTSFEHSSASSPDTCERAHSPRPRPTACSRKSVTSSTESLVLVNSCLLQESLRESCLDL